MEIKSNRSSKVQKRNKWKIKEISVTEAKMHDLLDKRNNNILASYAKEKEEVFNLFQEIEKLQKQLVEWKYWKLKKEQESKVKEETKKSSKNGNEYFNLLAKYAQSERKLGDAQEVISELYHKIDQHNDDIKEKNNEIKHLKQEIDEKDDEIRELTENSETYRNRANQAKLDLELAEK